MCLRVRMPESTWVLTMSFRDLRENISATRSLLSDAVRHLHAATPPTETVTPSSQHGSSVLSRTPAAAQRQQGPSVLSRMPAGEVSVSNDPLLSLPPIHVRYAFQHIGPWSSSTPIDSIARSSRRQTSSLYS